MRNIINEIIGNFVKKYPNQEKFADAMEAGTSELFKTDPAYAEILTGFAESIMNMEKDIMNRPQQPIPPGATVLSLMNKTETERIYRLWSYCTILYTIIENLEDADIIKVINPIERKAKQLWQNAKEKK